MKNNEIHNLLYEKYYINYNRTLSTSIHWDNYLKKYNIKKNKKGFVFKTRGLFAHDQNNYNFLKKIIMNLNLYFYLKKYKVNKKIINNAIKLNKKLNISINFDLAKNYVIYNILNRNNALKKNHTICIIGDGYGYLGQLIKILKKDVKIIYVNLGVNLLIDSYYYSKVFTDDKPLLLDDRNIGEVNKSSVIYVESENCALLRNIDIDLFINIASMQEMSKKIIKNYFDIIRDNSINCFFYCCNRISKKLNNGELINFDEYPWKINDKIIIEEECQWYSKYPTYFPFFWKPFNGKLKHKLLNLEKINE